MNYHCHCRKTSSVNAKHLGCQRHKHIHGILPIKPGVNSYPEILSIVSVRTALNEDGWQDSSYDRQYRWRYQSEVVALSLIEWRPGKFGCSEDGTCYPKSSELAIPRSECGIVYLILVEWALWHWYVSRNTKMLIAPIMMSRTRSLSTRVSPWRRIYTVGNSSSVSAIANYPTDIRQLTKMACHHSLSTLLGHCRATSGALHICSRYRFGFPMDIPERCLSFLWHLPQICLLDQGNTLVEKGGYTILIWQLGEKM